ncbi:hypothetical protein SACS_0699 [Parasaccharibacter apium]|uniref:Uncharacterized protein n=1 Tax=Parasaccharibacter apium TaxID=1510841 RepID=A0A7U7G5C8_9PROT|nr:hypothetical protein SACS_0699 [Parasaccharibacter apium]
MILQKYDGKFSSPAIGLTPQKMTGIFYLKNIYKKKNKINC